MGSVFIGASENGKLRGGMGQSCVRRGGKCCNCIFPNKDQYAKEGNKSSDD